MHSTVYRWWMYVKHCVQVVYTCTDNVHYVTWWLVSIAGPGILPVPVIFIITFVKYFFNGEWQIKHYVPYTGYSLFMGTRNLYINNLPGVITRWDASGSGGNWTKIAGLKILTWYRYINLVSTEQVFKITWRTLKFCINWRLQNFH